VRDAFIENLRSADEVGAAFALARGDELLVDLWGGHTDETRRVAVPPDALFGLFSTSKALAAVCIALLVDRGKLDYEALVGRYWPDFARNGKERVTLGQLMSHQAGLCGADERVTLEDFYAHERLARLLAAQRPFFVPGSAWGYHSLTFGTLTEELVRRVDGRTLGQLFAEEVAAPLALQSDVFLGLPASEDHRQLEMIAPPPGAALVDDPPNPRASNASYGNPVLDPEWPNRREWRAAGLPAAGGSANARGLARLSAVLANGGATGRKRLLSRETVERATRERIAGVDQVSGIYGRYAAGFALNRDARMGPNPQSFGHGGWGGSMAFGDPQSRIGVAYVTNRMLVGNPRAVDPRLGRLLQATYAVLEKG
jgi:CubicO group peptidase (beta-lactamase class C family)